MVNTTPTNLSKRSWAKSLPTVGTFSSPRVADLNGDGVSDIIMGGSRAEFESCDTAFFALDGATGDLLWHRPASDQVFGSAALIDINEDGVQDAIIAGRSGTLIAVNGANGHEIWRFLTIQQIKNPAKKGWYNFYNPQFVPDQDGDGLDDILVSNGGDVMAKPFDSNRPVGHLAVISTKSGVLLAKAPMPDGGETYMSVTVTPAANNEDVDIIFGTGGETIGGHLYVGKLSQVMTGDLSSAKVLHQCDTKGYIAPAVRVDINQDGQLDIIVNTVNGHILAFDGHHHELLWETTLFTQTECYSSLAVGQFNAEPTPDFFVSHAIGEWPNLEWNVQAMINGQNGQIEFLDSLGYYQIASPITVDWDGDGIDEVLLSVNFMEVNEFYQKSFFNLLALIDFKTRSVKQIGDIQKGTNKASTPWAGDLDQDGFLDLIYCHGTNPKRADTFDGIQVLRLASSNIALKKHVTWGSYQGSQYDGVFHPRK